MTLSLKSISLVSFSLMVEMVENVFYIERDTPWVKQGLFRFDCRNLLVASTLFRLDCIDVVNAEWKNISVIDCVYDCVVVEFVAKGLLRCL